jgi:hypothetical protein
VSEDRLTQALTEARKGGRDAVAYVPPTTDDLGRFREWLSLAFDGIAEGKTPEGAPPGFVIETIEPYVVLREEAARRRGAGAYVFRKGAAVALAIEAPHTFWDAGTLPIAITTFVEARARSLAVNTVHRYSVRIRAGRGKPALPDDDEDGSSISDVAHQERTYFQAVHEETVNRSAPAIQLHGFRDDAAPKGVAIVSPSGTTADAETVASALTEAMGANFLLYPRDIHKLGGTTNKQGVASAKSGAHFLHVELSKSLRDELASNASRRTTFARALIGAVTGQSLSPSPARR